MMKFPLQIVDLSNFIPVNKCLNSECLVLTQFSPQQGCTVSNLRQISVQYRPLFRYPVVQQHLQPYFIACERLSCA